MKSKIIEKEKVSDKSVYPRLMEYRPQEFDAQMVVFATSNKSGVVVYSSYKFPLGDIINCNNFGDTRIWQQFEGTIELSN
jgi:hypothetical protein